MFQQLGVSQHMCEKGGEVSPDACGHPVGLILLWGDTAQRRVRKKEDAKMSHSHAYEIAIVDGTLPFLLSALPLNSNRLETRCDFAWIIVA